MKHFVFLPLFLLAACSPLQERTTFPFVVGTNLPDTANEHGWSVELEEAKAEVGPVQFFEGEVLWSRRFSPWSFIVPVAVAHPGHYIAGESMGEWLGSAEVDLMGPATELGLVEAVTGQYGSMQLTLSSVLLKGVATKDTASIPFEVSIEVSTPLEGVRAEADVTPTPLVAQMTVDVAKWLQRVDFSTAVDADEDGLFTFEPKTQALNALTRAVANTGAYTVVFVPSEPHP